MRAENHAEGGTPRAADRGSLLRRAGRVVAVAGVTAVLLGALAIASVPVDESLARTGRRLPAALTTGLELGAARPTLVAFDLATGHLRWQARPPLAGVYKISAAPDGIEMEGLRTRHRCDFQTIKLTYTSTGRRIATSIVADPTVPPVGATQPSPSGPGVTLPNLGLELRFVTSGDTGPTGLPTTQLVAINTTTSRVVWTSNVGVGVGIVPEATPGGDLIVVTSAPEGIMSAPGANVAQPTDAREIKVLPDGATLPTVQVLDAHTGRLLWSEQGDGSFQPSVAVTSSVIYLFRGRQLVARDLRTGTVVLNKTVPLTQPGPTTFTVHALSPDAALALDPLPTTGAETIGLADSLLIISGSGHTAYQCGGE